MKPVCSVLSACLLFALQGCAEPGGAPGLGAHQLDEEEDVTPGADCPVLDSHGWTAWVNAMPGPDASATLIVEGVVDLPTPGYQISWAPGAADRSAIPVQKLYLVASAPDGMAAQVITSEAVRYEGPAIAKQYRGVVVMCGDGVLADITDVVTAQ